MIEGELILAVERLRRLKAGEPLDQAYRAALGYLGHRKDLDLVADAYLASHPADDGDLCDPAFMKTLPEPWQSMIPSWRDYGEQGFEVFVRLPGNAEIVLQNPTRGQLRKLLSVFADAALGVPLRAGPTEVES